MVVFNLFLSNFKVSLVECLKVYIFQIVAGIRSNQCTEKYFLTFTLYQIKYFKIKLAERREPAVNY